MVGAELEMRDGRLGKWGFVEYTDERESRDSFFEVIMHPCLPDPNWRVGLKITDDLNIFQWLFEMLPGSRYLASETHA